MNTANDIESKIALTFMTNERGMEIIFPTVELKEAYCKAELANMKCQQAYYSYQAERGLEDRKRSEQKLGHERYAFYKSWAAANLTPATRPNEPALA